MGQKQTMRSEIGHTPPDKLYLKNRNSCLNVTCLEKAKHPPHSTSVIACGVGSGPVAQQVLLSVSQSINNWQLDPTRPRFRNWLSRVTHNAIIDVFRRTKPDAAKGGSDIIDALGQFATAESEIAFEFERSVFRQAATKIRGEFNDETWQAFWQTTVLDESIVHCAAALNRSVGAVYTARSRVMKRLREMVATLKD